MAAIVDRKKENFYNEGCSEPGIPLINMRTRTRGIYCFAIVLGAAKWACPLCFRKR